jgi:hypothetical protein
MSRSTNHNHMQIHAIPPRSQDASLLLSSLVLCWQHKTNHVKRTSTYFRATLKGERRGGRGGEGVSLTAARGVAAQKGASLLLL